jgi:excisionase family DNA binding protein
MSRSAHGSVRSFGVNLDVIVSSLEPQRQPESLYSVREVAGQLGVHPETIRRLIHDGRLDAVRVGRVLRVHKGAVDSFLVRQRIKPTRQ